MEDEVVRTIKNGPKWEPAIQYGQEVNAYRRQPVTFVVVCK
jgi:periplasmic protein TonB